MNETEIREKIESLTDGQFIDVLDRICGISYGLTATEFILHECENNKEVLELINSLEK